MAIDVKGLGNLRAAEKAKAKPKAGAAGGPSFASLLEEAQSVAEPAGVAPAMLDAPAGYLPLEDDLPQNPRQQAQELLQTLQTLAGDAFAGTPTRAVERLEKLVSGLDESGLTAQQKEALNEARTRAAVEAAKLKP